MLAPTWIFFLLATITVPRPSVLKLPAVDRQMAQPDESLRECEGVI